MAKKYSMPRAVKIKKDEKPTYSFVLVKRDEYISGTYLSSSKRQYYYVVANNNEQALKLIWAFCKDNGFAMLGNSFHFSGFILNKACGVYSYQIKG